MYRAIHIAVTGGMNFNNNDIGEIYSNFRASYWIGEGDEGLYALACGSERGSENTSAAIAWETHFNRPAWLWPEATRTPERLHVGSKFSWQKRTVTLTSFGAKGAHVIACTYKSSKKGYSTERIDKRFRITFDELMSVRKGYDDRRRKILKPLADCENLVQLDAIGKKISQQIKTGGLRHFDIEIAREEFAKHGERINDAGKVALEERLRIEHAAEFKRLAETHDVDLARWLGGEAIDRFFDAPVRLRVKGEWVETSTQHRASVRDVRRLLPFVLRHRKKGWQCNGEMQHLDAHPLKAISAAGVTVGCTQVAWAEIDRIKKALVV